MRLLAYIFTDYAILPCSKLCPIMLEVDSDYAQIIPYSLCTGGGLAFVSHFLAISACIGAFNPSKNEQ